MPAVIDDYAFLDLLSGITDFSSNEKSFNEIYGHLPHESVFLEAPDYTIVDNVSKFSDSILSHDKRYHVSMASFIMLYKYFKFLAENGVFDNTYIIIVSDHGRGTLITRKI